MKGIWIIRIPVRGCKVDSHNRGDIHTTFDVVEKLIESLLFEVRDFYFHVSGIHVGVI